MKARIKNKDEVKANLKTAKSRFYDALRTAHNAVGLVFLDVMRSEAPVDEGDLREKIGMDTIVYKGGAVTFIGIFFDPESALSREGPITGLESDNPENYAHIVEFGSVHHAPNPFMERTRSQMIAAAPQILQQEFQRAFTIAPI